MRLHCQQYPNDEAVRSAKHHGESWLWEGHTDRRVVVDVGRADELGRGAAVFDPDILVLTHDDEDHVLAMFALLEVYASTSCARRPQLWLPVEWLRQVQAFAAAGPDALGQRGQAGHGNLSGRTDVSRRQSTTGGPTHPRSSIGAGLTAELEVDPALKHLLLGSGRPRPRSRNEARLRGDYYDDHELVDPRLDPAAGLPENLMADLADKWPSIAADLAAGEATRRARAEDAVAQMQGEDQWRSRRQGQDPERVSERRGRESALTGRRATPKEIRQDIKDLVPEGVLEAVLQRLVEDHLDALDALQIAEGEHDSTTGQPRSKVDRSDVEPLVERAAASIHRVVAVVLQAQALGFGFRWFDVDTARAQRIPCWPDSGEETVATIVNAREVLADDLPATQPLEALFFAARLSVQNRRALITFLWPSHVWGGCAHMRSSGDGVIIWSDSGGDIIDGPPDPGFVPWRHVDLMSGPHHGSKEGPHTQVYEHRPPTVKVLVSSNRYDEKHELFLGIATSMRDCTDCATARRSSPVGALSGPLRSALWRGRHGLELVGHCLDSHVVAAAPGSAKAPAQRRSGRAQAEPLALKKATARKAQPKPK